MKIGLEMTFVPDLPHAKEFTSLREAQRTSKALNRLLEPIDETLTSYETFLYAKVDPFRKNEDGDFDRWIIEVVNGSFPTHGFYWYDGAFVEVVQQVFNAAKSLKLYPRIRRDGIHHPSGGCHLHLGLAGLFTDDTEFLTKLARFEKNLFVDYANRPYIRWLFGEWFDPQVNAEVAVKEDDLKGFKSKSAYSYARDMTTSIRARYSCDGKPSYSTYEFRFFDMSDTAYDLALNVRFLMAWIKSLQSKNLHKETIPFTLTATQFRSLKNTRTAWKVISTFLRDLSLDPQDYRGAFESNYIPRMKYGKML